MTENEFNQLLEDCVEEKTTVTVGGNGGFYDGSYGKKVFGMNDTRMLQMWKDTMNDANLIYGKDIAEPGLNDIRTMYSYGKMKSYTFDPDLFFLSEKEKFVKIIDQCDIYVSHVGPVVPPNIRPEYMNATTGFYYFDGEHYLWSEKAPLLYVFGHTHDKHEFKVNNTWVVCNPLGYKSERTNTEIEVLDINTLY